MFDHLKFRVNVPLTWGEIGVLRGLLGMEIDTVERAYARGQIPDPRGLLRTMKRTKAKLDDLVERLPAVALGLERTDV